MLNARTEQGFTLVELMVTLAVFMLVASLASANWQGMIERHRSSQLKTQLRTAFQLARFHAIESKQLVTLCPLDDANQCTSSWNKPISIFNDAGNEKELKDPTNLLRTFNAINYGHIQASKSGAYERRYFQFRSDGTVHGSIGNLTWCPSSDHVQHSFQLIINFGGRIRWAQDKNGDGLVEDANGDTLVCN